MSLKGLNHRGDLRWSVFLESSLWLHVDNESEWSERGCRRYRRALVDRQRDGNGVDKPGHGITRAL